MDVNLLKAGFILLAAGAFLLLNLSSVRNAKKVLKRMAKEKSAKQDILAG